MLTTEEKLRHFSELVLAKAKQKADELIENSNREVKNKEREFENQCLEQAYQTIQIKTKRTRRKSQEKIAQMSLEAKRSLFRDREAMVDEIFSTVQSKLETFKNSIDYPGFLKEAIKKAEESLQTKDLKVFIDDSDQKFLSVLNRAFPSATFATRKDLLGGIQAENMKDGKAVDLSLAAALKRERQRFLTESGFILPEG